MHLNPQFSPEDFAPRSVTRAGQPGIFIEQQIFPLFLQKTRQAAASEHRIINSEQEFWAAGFSAFGSVMLKGFKISDWFPRTPGLFCSRHGAFARASIYDTEDQYDPALGRFFLPQSKLSLIEEGGLGTVRLRPRKIDGVDCWLATALVGEDCHAGIPLALPDSLLYKAGMAWGESADITGRLRFMQDAGLDDIAENVHHARPLIIFVDHLEPTNNARPATIFLSPVALFKGQDRYDIQYTFVNCLAGSDDQIERAADWIETYAAKFSGRVITNFDEQQPILANAPLSYQKLVSKEYDRTIVNAYAGPVFVERLDALYHEETNIRNFFGEVHMGHNINVTGPAIIAIDSTLNNVSQTIGSASGLNDTQKSEIERMIQMLRANLEPLKTTHPDETQAIADALQKATDQASKPKDERKPSMLQLTAKGLKDAAETVKDIAPAVLATAGLIAKFVVGLG